MLIGTLVREVEEHIANIRLSGMPRTGITYDILIILKVASPEFKHATYLDGLLDRAGSFREIFATDAMNHIIKPQGVGSARSLALLLNIYMIWKGVEKIQENHTIYHRARLFYHALLRYIFEEYPSSEVGNRYKHAAEAYQVRVSCITLLRNSLNSFLV